MSSSFRKWESGAWQGKIRLRCPHEASEEPTERRRGTHPQFPSHEAPEIASNCPFIYHWSLYSLYSLRRRSIISSYRSESRHSISSSSSRAPPQAKTHSYHYLDIVGGESSGSHLSEDLFSPLPDRRCRRRLPGRSFRLVGIWLSRI